MSDYNEKISALMDDEDYNGHLLDNLIKDQEMQKTWSRYHLIGDCLRGNLPEHISQDLVTHVNEKLKSDPTVLAPTKNKQLNLKPLAGFAIAASVALVAVLGIQANKEDKAIPSLPVISSTPVAITTEPQTFSFAEPQVLPAAVTKSDTPQSMVNQRMNNYLLNHNEYRSNTGMNGILPYVRIVTIESQE